MGQYFDILETVSKSCVIQTWTLPEMQGPGCPLQTRILFHTAHKQGDENKLMHYHGQLTESIEDQLSLAAIHYLRSHFQARRLPRNSEHCMQFE